MNKHPKTWSPVRRSPWPRHPNCWVRNGWMHLRSAPLPAKAIIVRARRCRLIPPPPRLAIALIRGVDNGNNFR